MSKRKNSILRVGVTGGIGSGKSLVCRLLSDLGFPVLSADLIAKQLMQTDQGLRRRLARLLGPDAYLPDGTLNRPFVASRIFTRPPLQRSVNRLVHPMVESFLDHQFARMRRQGVPVAIVEAALIFEAGYHRRLDLVIVIDAPRGVRVNRVRKRDHTSVAEVRRRMRAQWPMPKKIKLADYVLHNSGSKSQLQKSVRFLADILSTIAKRP